MYFLCKGCYVSLFTRVIGLEEDNKIGLHKMQSVVSEVNLGRLTFDQSVELLGLVGGEVSDLATFFANLTNITGDKTPVSQTIFNYLCLGEMKISTPRDYTDEALFWEMVAAEAV